MTTGVIVVTSLKRKSLFIVYSSCFVPSVSVYRAQLYGLGFYWFGFHFSPFGGVIKAFPVTPVNTVRIRGVLAIKIATI